MKKSILLVASFVVGTMAQAQYHEAKLDIGGMGLGSYGALYEYGINDDMGINTRIAYYSTDNDNTYSTLTFTADFRYYFDAYEGGDGWFGTAYLKYRSLKSENYWGTTAFDNSGNRVYEDYTSGGIALGVTTGRKWIVNDNWILECYGGIGRYLINFGGEQPDDYDPGLFEVEDGALDFPLDIRLGFIVGYRF